MVLGLRPIAPGVLPWCAQPGHRAVAWGWHVTASSALLCPWARGTTLVCVPEHTVTVRSAQGRDGRVGLNSFATASPAFA